MSGERTVAKRYAKASFHAVSPERAESLVHALRAFAELLEKNPDLRAALLNPAVSDTEKTNVLTDVSKGINNELLEFGSLLYLILDNKRLSLVPLIVEELDALVKRYKKLLSVAVSSAREISTEEKEALLTKLRSDLGSLVEVEWKIDASLIGGMQVRCGDTVLDSTVRGNIEKLRGELLGS